MMRIGLVIDTDGIGGAETMVFETAHLLKENGDEPVLIHFGSSYVETFAQKHEIENYIIPNRTYYKKTILLPIFAIKLRSFLRSLQLDCLHTHLFGPIVAFAMAARFVRLPHVGTLHDIYMIEEAPRRILLLKLASLLKTHLIAVSQPMKEFYEKMADFTTNPITYIPNCTPRNQHLNNRTEIRRQLQLSKEDIAIISVGRLVSLKHFEILIQAMSLFADQNNVFAYIAGDGPERNSLKSLASRLGIDSRVIFLGERDDIPQLLAASDIFTLTSETEGMSRSILEALAASLPVIATNVGGNCDLVSDGDNGILMADDKPSTLYYDICHLTESKTIRNAMGRYSLERAEKEFNPELFLKRHISAYERAITQ